ncbi:hypothetical protein NEOLEDRAFT_639727 [Neolentinus lepideus HHB14362 ss-1]|uniref:Uncharacterized protein n=1 Tax=Neolentinus lepideus HHB14362 ss-1 TaxID=1314782 RepID=A0A165QPF2_9AGAM|nr:hypothetical protein NEOLEDRAFT_639727 [Neolentinus lepideus HHB14362 ss-1]
MSQLSDAYAMFYMTTYLESLPTGQTISQRQLHTLAALVSLLVHDRLHTPKTITYALPTPPLTHATIDGYSSSSSWTKESGSWDGSECRSPASSTDSTLINFSLQEDKDLSIGPSEWTLKEAATRDPHGYWWRGTHTNALDITDSEAASILMFTFKSWELFKLDPNPQRRAEVRHRVSRNWTAEPTPSWIAEYPTPDTIYSPLQTYFSLVAVYAPRMIELGGRYIRTLKNLELKYSGGWETLLEYHIAFFDARNEDMRKGIYDGWEKVNWRLYWTVQKQSALRRRLKTGCP